MRHQQPKPNHASRWRRAVPPLVFCLLTLVLFVVLDQLVWDKGGTMSSFYVEPVDSIDVLFIGGSHTNAAFSPTQIFTRQGFTSYVLYSWSQPPWTSYHYLKEGLKTQKPKVVVLDAFGLTYGHTYMTDNQTNSISDQYSMLIRPGLNRLQLAFAMSRCQTNHRPVSEYFSLFQCHNRWKTLKPEDWLWFAYKPDISTGKGYGPLYTTESIPVQEMPAGTAENDLMEPVCEEYLRRFFALAREEGFALVVTALPYECTADEYGIYAKIARLCAENEVPFLNYFDPDTAAQAGFDWTQHMAEHAHVNYRGAEALSAHMAAYLDARYDLPDHRQDPTFAGWQDAAALEAYDLMQMDLRVTTDLAAVLQKAENAGFLVLAATRGDPRADAAGLDSVRAAFVAEGLNTAPLDEAGGCGMYLRLPGGAWQQQTAGSGDGPLTLTLSADETGLEGAEPSLSAFADGQSLEVWVAGEQVALDHDGVSLIIIDPARGKLVHSVCFNASEDYAAYTD